MNLSWITPHLAIGGRLSPAEIARLRVEHDVFAVVDLRSETVDDAGALESQGIAFLHLPTDDHAAIDGASLDRGVAFIEHHVGREQRTLVHCEHGIGRSATLVLAALVNQGLTPIEALALAKAQRERVSPSPAQYAGWCDWLTGRRNESGEAWAIPDFEAFAAIAYRHLRPATP